MLPQKFCWAFATVSVLRDSGHVCFGLFSFAMKEVLQRMSMHLVWSLFSQDQWDTLTIDVWEPFWVSKTGETTDVYKEGVTLLWSGHQSCFLSRPASNSSVHVVIQYSLSCIITSKCPPKKEREKVQVWVILAVCCPSLLLTVMN